MNGDKEIFGRILNRILEDKRKDFPYIIGINGIDTSGKTFFTEKLEEFLSEKEIKVQCIHGDDFHFPKKIRYEGDNESYNYFYKSFDFEKMIREILSPVKKGEKVEKELVLLNLETDMYSLRKNYSIDSGTIVLLEGVFLFQEKLIPYIDLKIFLSIDFDICLERAKKRDLSILKDDVERKYRDKYIPAQKLYIQDYKPLDIAEIVIDNKDYFNPRLLKQ